MLIFSPSGIFRRNNQAAKIEINSKSKVRGALNMNIPEMKFRDKRQHFQQLPKRLNTLCLRFQIIFRETI